MRTENEAAAVQPLSFAGFCAAPALTLRFLGAPGAGAGTPRLSGPGPVPGSLLPTPEVQSSFCGSWRLVSTRPRVTRKTSLQQARPGRTGQCGSRLGLTGVAAGGDVQRQGPGPRLCVHS